MIAFDNGPARGDYVRYIEDLMARAALAAPAAVSSDGDMASGVDALIREQSAAAPRSGDAAGQWMPTASGVGRGRQPTAPSSSGFATPTGASPAATAASAIASALMSGQVGRRSALSTQALLAVAGIVLGGVLVLAGLLWPPFNPVSAVGGAVLIAWAVRRLQAIGARARRSKPV